MITRFAPSPTGQLHLGHAASAWHVWKAAETAGGEVLLRIEDIDTTRCKAAYTQSIFEDLSWLGFTWQEPVRVQSQHFAEYASTVQALAAKGLAYRCFHSRRDLAQFRQPYRGGPLSPEAEREKLAAGIPYAWRLSLSATAAHLGPLWSEMTYTLWQDGALKTVPVDPEIEGDFVLQRKDSPSAYHLATTHDDALQGITHIVRGTDLAEAVHVQTLLQTLMGWPSPVYTHHPLVLDDTGRKLSKRARSTTLAALRTSGITADQIWGRLSLER